MPKPKEPNHEFKEGEKIKKEFVGEIVKANDKERTIIGIASHESVDRAGDVIKQGGWDLKNIKKNGVMLWGHDHKGLPIAKILKIWIDGKKLMFEAKFAGLAEAHPFAEAIYKLMKNGYLNAFSVGFIPLELEPNVKTGGWTINKSELIEISVVNVPCHPQALIQTVKSVKSIPKYAETPDDVIKQYIVDGMVEDELQLTKAEGGDEPTDTTEADPPAEDDKDKNHEEKIKFLSGLLAEKHEELKLMRKYFAIFSKVVAVERTENEIETINKIGLGMIGVLKGFDMIQSKTKVVVEPKENPKAIVKARTAEDDESELLNRLAGE